MRVVIGEDQALMLEGLALLLERDGAEVVGRTQHRPPLMGLGRAESSETGGGSGEGNAQKRVHVGRFGSSNLPARGSNDAHTVTVIGGHQVSKTL